MGKLFKCFKKKEDGFKEEIKGVEVFVQEAPEPQDIYWENLGTPIIELLIRRSITTILSGILLGISLVIIILLKDWQDSYDK